MQQRLERKFVVVVRRTRLRDMVVRHSTVSQARFRSRALGGDWADVEREHGAYEHTVGALRRRLGDLARVVVLERELVPTHVFGPHDIIVCVGQDGLVANCLKYTNGQYVLGINPDPARFDGILLGWNGGDLDVIVRDAERALDSRLPSRSVTMAEARLADGQILRGVNDIFIGLRDHASARYQITHAGRTERQSSCGVLVTTGLGTTGWLKSIVSTARAMSALVEGHEAPGGRTIKLAWEARELVFSVREAFPSKWTQSNLVFGRISERQPLVVNSENPESGVIFSDGMQRDALEFNAPQRVEVGIASAVGRIGWPVTSPREETTRRSKPTRARTHAG
jgi:hypothetical protein